MKIAFYLRLSESDGDLQENDESNSIENQRTLLYSYVEKKEELMAAVEEYVDDGYTGTNFNRPAFQRMIEDAKKGKINTIIVKDLSRLGRDYITVGDYIEQIFPLLGVRFIAVTSNYDSSVKDNPTMDFEMAVSNLINTFYSRDLSRKMRSAQKVKWQKGITTSGHPPFGYIKDPADKKKWILDPEASKIVRRLFDLALSGMNTTQIARTMNDEGYPTPCVYNETHKNWKLAEFVTKKSERLWTSNLARYYLIKRDYTGAMIMGRTEVVTIGSNKKRKLPESKWYIAEGVNEAIVSLEEYEEAQCVIRSRAKPDFIMDKQYVLKGHIRCGNCRCCLDFSDECMEEYYSCKRSISIGDQSECCKEKYMVKQVDHIVYQALKKHIVLLKELGLLVEQKARKEILEVKHKITEDRTLADRLKAEKVRQYEAYAEGLITREEYIRKKNELTDKIAALEEASKSIESSFDENKELLETAEEMADLAEEFEESTRLTRKMVEKLINTVYAYDPEHYHIVFRFDDKIAKMREIVNLQ